MEEFFKKRAENDVFRIYFRRWSSKKEASEDYQLFIKDRVLKSWNHPTVTRYFKIFKEKGYLTKRSIIKIVSKRPKRGGAYSMAAKQKVPKSSGAKLKKVSMPKLCHRGNLKPFFDYSRRRRIVFNRVEEDTIESVFELGFLREMAYTYEDIMEGIVQVLLYVIGLNLFERNKLFDETISDMNLPSAPTGISSEQARLILELEEIDFIKLYVLAGICLGEDGRAKEGYHFYRSATEPSEEPYDLRLYSPGDYDIRRKIKEGKKKCLTPEKIIEKLEYDDREKFFDLYANKLIYALPYSIIIKIFQLTLPPQLGSRLICGPYVDIKSLIRHYPKDIRDKILQTYKSYEKTYKEKWESVKEETFGLLVDNMD